MNKKFSNTLANLIVVKRSGQRVNFNGNKIAIAIKQAFDNVFESPDENSINKVYEEVLKYIELNYKGRKTINVEDIQDIIEQELKAKKYLNVYEHFNSYRQKRTALRKVFEEKQDHKFAKAVEKLNNIIKNNEQNFNSNVINKFGNTISTEYAKAYVLENKFIKLLDEGIIEINNLDEYITSKTQSTHLDFSTLTACNIEQYIDEMLRIILNLKKEQYGELNIASFDYIFEKIIIQEFKKILITNLKKYLKFQGLLNFIKFDLIEEKILNLKTIYIEKDYFNVFFENKIIENIFEIALNDSILELKNTAYNSIKKLLTCLDENASNTSKVSISLGTNNISEESLFIRVLFFKVVADISNLKNVNIIYKINQVNDEELKLVLDLIKQGKIIYILTENKQQSYKDELEVFSTGERIYENIINETNNSLGRILLSTTSINLARLGLEFKNKNIKEFYDKLSEVLEIVKNQLVQRFELQGSKYKEDYKYLFQNNNIFDSSKLENNQKIRKIIRNGVLNISLVGLYECSLILSNSNSQEKQAYKILEFIQSKISDFMSEEKLNFIISESYNENILEKLISIDKSIYGIISVLNKNKYENFCKFYEKLDLEEKLQKEGKYQEKISSIINIDISKNISIIEFLELIKLLQKFNIIFCKMEVK